MSFRKIVEWLPPNTGVGEPLRRWLEQMWLKLAQVDEWHNIGDTNEPAFENSWDNTGGTYSTAAYYKDPFGRIHLKGTIDSGTSGTACFTLPETYRPNATCNFAADRLNGSGGHARIEINSSGEVIPIVSGAGPIVNLCNVSFREP